MKLRHVLVVLLLLVAASTSPAQKLVGEGKIFVRLTNLRPDDAAILVRVNITPNHNKPFGWRGWVTLVGQIEDPHEVKHADKWLRPGASSPWVDLGKSMTLRGTRSPDTYLSPGLFGVEGGVNLQRRRAGWGRFPAGIVDADVEVIFHRHTMLTTSVGCSS